MFLHFLRNEDICAILSNEICDTYPESYWKMQEKLEIVTNHMVILDKNTPKRILCNVRNSNFKISTYILLSYFSMYVRTNFTFIFTCWQRKAFFLTWHFFSICFEKLWWKDVATAMLPPASHWTMPWFIDAFSFHYASDSVDLITESFAMTICTMGWKLESTKIRFLCFPVFKKIHATLLLTWCWLTHAA